MDTNPNRGKNKPKYKEKLTKRLYIALVATKLATRQKSFADTREIKGIVKPYDSTGYNIIGSSLASLNSYHYLLDVKKGHCIMTDRHVNLWRVNKKGNDFIKRNISTQSPE